MLDYLHANNYTEAYNALQSETGITYNPDPKSKYAALLEKKWTSVIRLQKKVCGGHRDQVQSAPDRQTRSWISRIATLR